MAAIEFLIVVSDLLNIPVRSGYLFRPLSVSGEVMAVPFESSAAQSRLSYCPRFLARETLPFTVFGVGRQSLWRWRALTCLISSLKWNGSRLK